MFKEKKIEGSTKYLMVGTAIALDILGWVLLFIPVAGEIANEFVGVFGNLIFLLWFWMKGISPLKKKRLLNFLGNFAGEEATFGIWPGFIVMVGRTIITHNAEMAVLETERATSKVAGSISPKNNQEVNKKAA